MNVFTKLCCLILLPHWIAANSSSNSSSSESKELKKSDESVENTLKRNFPKVNNPQWFKQITDHFYMSENVLRWKQRYFVNDAHYKTGKGPVFLIIGSNAEINYQDIESGTWYEYAKKADALLVYVEHRYFGQSRPTKNLKVNNFIDNNLSLLTNEQTLADFGYFIYHFKELYSLIIPAKTKWITFGRGVGGSLAARMRLKFPQLVHAAVASGASLLETQTFEYFQFIEDELNNYANVKKTIKDAFDLIVHSFDTSTIQLLKLKNIFNLCTFLPKDNESLHMLYWMISHILAQVVIFRDNKFEKNILDMLGEQPKPDQNALHQLGAAIVQYINKYDKSCLPVDYKKIVELYQHSKWEPKEKLSHILKIGFGNRQNLYHRCTENGRFETHSKNQKLFLHGMHQDFYIKFCEKVFGKILYKGILSSGVRRNIINYGGILIIVSRVIFVNAYRDPTSKLSITKTDEKKQIIAFNMKDAVPGEDLTVSNKRSVEEVQNKIPHILNDWLKLE